ncbi:CHAT domain-containing protein [Calothrix sp. FACHB-1219]|uniref:CHAT domain-containing protein n=1 Tax=unclassified Calothrix TaxID=2619626 RepID=UPI001686FBB2|nr:MULTISPECIES: CHAT domain-containing protein [unclassified Calothrix]MBD2207646.1 CHAT domain-containing protein [Calothrix sp. FACHB-168]MBD2222287.1 CHAT domain-containing protein [Calothrix sp. FACHB-1219]
MRRRYRPIASSLQSLSVASLALYLTFPLGTFIAPLRISPVLAQSSSDRQIEADKLLKQGEDLVNRNQSQAALPLFEQALTIYRQIKNRQGEGRTLKGIGNVYYDLGDYKQAITYQQQALDIAQAINDRDLAARALNNLGSNYRALGDLPQAIAYYQQALAIARQIQDLERETNTLENLGYVYATVDLTQAIDFLAQALVLLRKQSADSPQKQLNLRKQETDILIALARNYYLFGVDKGIGEGKSPDEAFNKAIEIYQQAVSLGKQTGDRSQLANALLGLGNMYNAKSKYNEAVATLQQALQIFQTDKKSPIKLRDTLSKLGEVYQGLRQPEQALTYYQQALEIAKQITASSPFANLEKDKEQGLIMVNLANIYAETGKYEKAIQNYQDGLVILQSSLKQAEQITDPAKKFLLDLAKQQLNQVIKFSYVRMCAIYKTLGQSAEAKQACAGTSPNVKSLTSANKTSPELEAALKKLNQAQALGKPEMIAYALAEIADAYADLQESDRAWEYYQKAIALAEEYPQFQQYIYFKVGGFYENQKKYDLAIKFYKKAALSARKAQQKFDEVFMLNQLANTSYTAGKLTEATEALYEAIKVYESLRIDLTDKSQISIFETQAQTYSLLQKILITQNKVNEALEVAERSRARAFVNLLTSRLSATQNRQLTADLPTIEKIRKIAQVQNATIVSYSLVNYSQNNDKKKLQTSEIYIWVIKPQGEITFKSVNLQSLNQPLTDIINQSRVSLGAGGRGIKIEPNDESLQKQYLQELYQILIAPIASLLPNNPNERVIFIPHQSLFLVPFPALQAKNDKYLIEKHTILTAPAIQVLELTRQQRQKVKGKDVLVIGNPTMPKVGTPSVQLQPLSGAEIEAVTIANLLKTQAITGEEATKTAFKQKLASARIIHLATHGLLDDPTKGIKTAIALAPTANDDGLLTPAEIVNLPINAELVVLSACDTGRGAITGDGVIGLSRSLITAGATSVIVSLWSVPDSPTSELMTEFYQQWQQNPDKAVALRNAMLDTMKKYPNPVNWAAFTLIGEAI